MEDKKEKTISIPAPLVLIGAAITANGIYKLGVKDGYKKGFKQGYDLCSSLTKFACDVIGSVTEGKES